MNPPGVVKIHIMLDTKAELRQADIVLDFDVLIFQRPPEALHLCIIQTPSPSVHADLNAMVPKFRHELRTGKLASLIRIKKSPVFHRNPLPFLTFQHNEKRPLYLLQCKPKPCG